MIRKIGLVAALLVVGIAIAMYLRSGSGSGKAAQAFTPRAGASEAERIADLEKTLAAQVDRANMFESRLRALESRNRADGPRSPGGPGPNDPRMQQRMDDVRRQLTDANGNFDPAKMQQFMRQQQLDRLVQGGFTRERAEWIERRTQELQLQTQQAMYDAQRNGQPFQPTDPEAALRKEMGDAEYEKYLKATGRPTDVPVMDVLASSAAEKAGLKPGDQITSYAGQRVYDIGSLETLTRQGTPGESVTVEVQRDGQTLQLQVPRGVLGVQGGGFAGGFTGGFGGGPPGGFGGVPGGAGRPPNPGGG